MPSRRRLLAALGAGLGAGLAGCTGGSPTPDDGPADSPTDSPTDGGPTPTSRDDAPSGPGVAWTAFLGSVPVETVVADGSDVYAVGGTNDRGTPPGGDYVRPDSSRDLYAFDAGGERRWRYEAPAGVFDPTPAADGVYATVGWSAGTHGLDQRVVRVAGGERRWATDSVDRFLNVLAAAEGAVYVGTADDQRGLQGEELFSLAADGTERWRVETGDASFGAVAGGRLYVPFADRQVVAFDADSGGQLWTASGGLESNTPTPAGGQLYLDTEEKQSEGYPVRAVDVTDASTAWSFVVATDDGSPFVPTGAARSGDTVYVTEYGGTLFALDAGDGTERWRYDAGSDTRDGLLVAGDTVYLGTNTDGVHAVGADGDRRWRRSLDGTTFLLGADGDGVAASAVGKEESELVAFDAGGGERWTFGMGGRPSPTAAVGSRVYAGTKGGYLVALAG